MFHLAVTLCLSVRRFPRHCRHHVVEGRDGGLRGRRGFARWHGHEGGGAGREDPGGHGSVGHEATPTTSWTTASAPRPVREEPVAPRSHPLSLSLVNLTNIGELENKFWKCFKVLKVLNWAKDDQVNCHTKLIEEESLLTKKVGC